MAPSCVLFFLMSEKHSEASCRNSSGRPQGSSCVKSLRSSYTGLYPQKIISQETERRSAIGAMALLPICDSSFTCEDYNTFRAHPWNPFPLRRAHPGPGPHKLEPFQGVRVFLLCQETLLKGGSLNLKFWFVTWPGERGTSLIRNDPPL